MVSKRKQKEDAPYWNFLFNGIWFIISLPYKIIKFFFVSLFHFIKKEKTEVKEVKTSTKEEKSNKVVLKKYNVVGGVFSIKDNANNYVKKSQADGYPAAIAGKNKRGYWVVSLASANSEAELEATLESIKATYEKNAWIYKK